MIRLELDTTKRDQLKPLHRLLWKWNRAHNLFSRKLCPEELEIRLLECLAFEPFLPPHARVADLGSGAGLPGLPLAVVRPDLQMTLIEPRAKRCTWLRYAAQQLSLSIHVTEGHWNPQWTQYDRIVSRAVFPPAAFTSEVGKLASVSLQMTGPTPDMDSERTFYGVWLEDELKGSILAGRHAEVPRSSLHGQHHSDR